MLEYPGYVLFQRRKDGRTSNLILISPDDKKTYYPTHARAICIMSEHLKFIQCALKVFEKLVPVMSSKYIE